MKVEVCHALPDGATRIDVVLEESATVADALRVSGIEARFEASAASLAIFGRRVSRDAVLHDGDRVEILRPLQIDPMEARRLRARRGETTRRDE